MSFRTIIQPENGLKIEEILLAVDLQNEIEENKRIKLKNIYFTRSWMRVFAEEEVK